MPGIKRLAAMLLRKTVTNSLLNAHPFILTNVVSLNSFQRSPTLPGNVLQRLSCLLSKRVRVATNGSCISRGNQLPQNSIKQHNLRPSFS